MAGILSFSPPVYVLSYCNPTCSTKTTIQGNLCFAVSLRLRFCRGVEVQGASDFFAFCVLDGLVAVSINDDTNG